jgi:hypothetical protein
LLLPQNPDTKVIRPETSGVLAVEFWYMGIVLSPANARIENIFLNDFLAQVFRRLTCVY